MGVLQIDTQNKRPPLNRELDNEVFKNFYYLKKELIEFCRCHKLPTSGRKAELTERITHYLKTGKIVAVKSVVKNTVKVDSKKLIIGTLLKEGEITEDSLIEPNFICSEIHRSFFKSKIGKSFSFKVAFQKWLKSSSGKTYNQAIEAYYEILEHNKSTQTTIDSQFEYNTYIRDFFVDNQDMCLTEAISCWKFKKSQPGHNRYEKLDLAILEKS